MRITASIKHILRGGCIAITVAVSSLASSAQGTAEKVIVTTPGTLMELVSNLESSRIYSLKVEGALNAADLSYIGGESGKIKTVKELDLSDITLVSGPESYKKYQLRDNENGLLGNTTATFFISDTARIESRVVDIALGGQSTLQNVYGKNLAGLFAGCGYEKVVLPSGMTSLGYASFFGADGIKEVVFPSSVQEIETDAFYSAITLTQVDLPESLKKIGSNSFSKTGLTEISLPASLDSICGRAFKESPLTKIDLGNVKFVGYECFAGCKLEGMLDVSGLDIIPEGAFAKNEITGITFGKRLTEIGDDAFSSNRQLLAISLPVGLKSIGAKAFYECYELSSVDVPTTLENIGYQAFDKTEWKMNLKGENGVVYLGSIAYAYDYDSAQDSTILEFKEGTTVISSCFQIESISDGYGNYFHPEEEITTIIFPSSLKRIEGRDNGYSSGLFSGMVKLGDIVFNEGLEYIGEAAFSGCEKMWFEKLPSSLKYIGICAFQGCNGLTEITLSEGLNYLGYNAFEKCKGLYSIKYNCNIENKDKPCYYSGERFSGCEGLYQILIGKDVINIPEGMFSNSGVRKVTFEDVNERSEKLTLGAECFSGCGNLTEITLPSMHSIGNGCFNNSSLKSLNVNGDCELFEEGWTTLGKNIESVIISGRVTKIGDSTLAGGNIHTFKALSCDTIGISAFRSSKIQNFVVSEGGCVIGKEAFYYCKSLENISINDDSELGDGAFAYSSIKEVNLGAGIVTIPDNTFYDCNSLKNLYSKSKIEYVGDGAFMRTSLSSFDFENIKHIGGSAFAGIYFSDMPELYLPDGFNDIGGGAFSGCSFSSVSLPVSLLTIPEVTFKDGGRFELEWRIPEGYEYDGSSYNVIYNAAFASALTNTEVIVPEGVNEIKNIAFYNNNIKTISLPSTLQVLFANALQKGEGGTVETIYCHAKTPPSVDTYGLLDKWVDDIFKGVIYVPAESLNIYKQDYFWGRYNIQSIPVDVDAVVINKESITLVEGETYQLTAIVEPAEATDKTLVWTSSDESVAIVSTDGNVTAINEGSAVITVSTSNGLTANCDVTVEAKVIEMVAIVLNAEELALEVGDSYHLQASVVPEDTTDSALEWWSDDENVAVVDQNGFVTVTGEGETLIHVRSAAWNYVEAVCRLNAVADVEGIICDDLPCDIYLFSGEMLRKGVSVSEIEHLRKGVYIICQGTTRIKLIK